MSHKKAIAITCFVALMWSLAGFNIKMIEWSPYAIAAGRSLVAVILLAPQWFLRKGFQKNRPVCHPVGQSVTPLSTTALLPPLLSLPPPLLL